MNFGFPANTNNYYTLLYQNGGSLYRGEGETLGYATNLDSQTAVESFISYVDMYRSYKLDIQIDFQNRFRTGEVPIGVADFTTVNALSVTAPEIRGLWSFASLSIAAQIGTSPLVAYAFGSLPTYFLISNLVAVPCATLLLYLVVALFLTTPLPVVQTVVAQMVVSVAKVMNEVLRWVSSLPCATIELHPTILQTVLCYALLLTIWAMGWRLQQRFQSSKNELT